MRTRITHIWMTPGVVAGDKKIPFIQDAEILIDGNRIVYAGKRDEAPAFEAEQVIDGKGALAMPGLCNLHTHTPMTLFRSIGADLPLDRWLQEAIWPLEKFLTDDAVRAGTDLGTLEMLRYGTTSFNDMYFRMDRMAESVQESGMRAMLGHGVVDFDESCSDLLPGIAFAEKWNGAANDRIHVNLAPHSEGATTRKVMERTVEEARRLNVAIHIHVSETKADRDGSVQRRDKTPPQYLDELGMLDGPLLAAHCVWMDDEDIRLFAEKGTYIVHNPISNLKLASGVAPIARMLAAGSCAMALSSLGRCTVRGMRLLSAVSIYSSSADWGCPCSIARHSAVTPSFKGKCSYSGKGERGSPKLGSWASCFDGHNFSKSGTSLEESSSFSISCGLFSAGMWKITLQGALLCGKPVELSKSSG